MGVDSEAEQHQSPDQKSSPLRFITSQEGGSVKPKGTQILLEQVVSLELAKILHLYHDVTCHLLAVTTSHVP